MSRLLGRLLALNGIRNNSRVETRSLLHLLHRPLSRSRRRSYSGSPSLLHQPHRLLSPSLRSSIPTTTHSHQ